MKSELIENLIVAHCSGDENNFRAAVEKLASDEENKGNVALAAKIRRAYETKKKGSGAAPEFFQSSSMFSLQSAAPRDKDSLLELYEIVESTIKLEDVILPQSQKEVLQTIISEQKNAEKLKTHNMAPVNRILFCGPPGCGKTMTAYAIGHELGLPIAYVRLDGLVSSYLGQTSTNLRRVFDSLREKRIILFLDEFDAIAKKRDDSNELGELKRVVTTLLQNFDNMPDNIFLIAATNHEQLLDPAIWRRFNATIMLDLPTEEQRETLIKKWFDEYGITSIDSVESLAKISEGLSCAQIKEWAMTCGKTNLIEDGLSVETATAILIRQLTKYSGENNASIKMIIEMKERGVSTRQIGKALGIPSTTLDYQIKKYKEMMTNG